MRSLLDLVFPRRCLTCGIFLIDECPWCLDCHRFIGYMASKDVCGRCGDELGDGDCLTCHRRRPAYDSLKAALVYEDDVASLLARVKYSRDLAAGRSLTRWLKPSLAEEYEQVTVVPVHTKDLQSRGFHLPTLTARWLGYSPRHVLKKPKRSEAQASLSAAQRKSNLLGAFECSKRLEGAWLLVDDVATTGATLSEAARALKSAGAETVHALVLAKSL